jgi:hypothetical protein
MSTAKRDAKIPPKPGKEVVYLDVDDDITTVIDKVGEAKDKIVALVLPKRFATLQSIVNMRLLKRSADSASKNIVLITSEAALLPLAGAAGLHVAKNLQSKPEVPPSPVAAGSEKPVAPADPDAEVDADDAKLDYHRSIGVLAAGVAIDEPETIPLEDADEAEQEIGAKPKKTPRDKKLKVPNFERFRLGLVLAAAGGAALIVFLILAIFVLPKATVTLQTEATPVSATFELDTSTKVTALDEKQGLIPAELKSTTLTSTQKVQATGEQNNGKKASGSVEMTTCVTGPGQLKDVPAGTGISTNGLNFITQQNATFSFTFQNCSSGGFQYKSQSVTITAQQGGSKYNVSNTTFSVTGRSDTSASGSASGGTDDIKTVVSQQDVNSAAGKVSDEDKNKFVDEFKKKLGDDGFYLIDATFKAKDPAVSSSPAVGEAGDEAEVTVKINYSVLAVPKTELQKAVTDQLNKQIDTSKQKIGDEDVLKDITVSVQSQKSSSVATLSISADSTAVAIIDTGGIKQQVSGKKSGDINKLLSDLPGVKNVDVKMSPFWVSKAPKAGKITIVEQQVKAQPASEN